MDQELNSAREHFIGGLSRIANFWGFPKAMGAIYGSIYLSPEPVTMDFLVKDVGVTKGAISANIRVLERMRMIQKQVKLGDRKDYFIAETDFWKIIKGILREREKNEFNLALKSVGESLDIVKKIKSGKSDNEMTEFYKERMKEMKDFFNTLDSIIATFIAIDNLRSGTIKKLLGKIPGK